MKIILFVFAGRRVNLEIQRPFLDRILETYPDSELHYWDLTRNADDAAYLATLHDPDAGVRVIDHLHPGHPIPCGKKASMMAVPPPPSKRPARPTPRRVTSSVHPVRTTCACMTHRPPYEEPYRWYATHEGPDDTVYVKLDDDVLFLETDRFDDLVAPLAEAPGAVVSANVTNNAVCAKHDPIFLGNVGNFGHGDPAAPKNDRAWWSAHTSAKFARASHDWFLRSTEDITANTGPATYAHTRPGEAVSINCVAFTQITMRRLATMFDRPDRLGDEGAVDALLPRIATTFHAAHLTFGPQDKHMTAAELDEYRSRYSTLAKEYLR